VPSSDPIIDPSFHYELDLFSGANFESEQLDKFITDTLESIEAQDDAKVQGKEDA